MRQIESSEYRTTLETRLRQLRGRSRCPEKRGKTTPVRGLVVAEDAERVRAKAALTASLRATKAHSITPAAVASSARVVCHRRSGAEAPALEPLAPPRGSMSGCCGSPP